MATLCKPRSTAQLVNARSFTNRANAQLYNRFIICESITKSPGHEPGHFAVNNRESFVN